jgi:hypothetical protein
MLLVLIAVAMCTILALSFLAAQQPTAAVASNIDRKTKARAIAESALKMAIDYVNEDENWRTDKTSGAWLVDAALDGGTFTLTGTDEADGDLTNDTTEPVTLIVVATYDGVTHRVSAVVTPGSDAPGQSPGLFTQWWDLSIQPRELDDIDWDATPTTITIEEDIDWRSTGSTWMSGFPSDDFAVELSGYLTVPTSGLWTLYLDSDDGSELLFDGAMLIDNDGLHGMRERSGTVTLTAGQAYPIRVRFFERGGGAGLEMDWRGPSQSKQRVPASAFTYDDPTATTDEEEGLTPTLLALYEFEQVEVEPTLAGRWKLDETASGAGGLVANNGRLTLHNGSSIDAYDSSLGPYGGTNLHRDVTYLTDATGSGQVRLTNGRIYGDVYVGQGGNPSNVITLQNGSQITGSTAAQSANANITNYDAPSGFGGHSGNQTYNGGTHTWSSDRHFNQLTITNGARVFVSGDVAIRVSNQFNLQNGRIILNPGASLTMWVGHNVTINNGSTINDDTERTDDFTLIMYGNNRDFNLQNGRVCGAIHVADDLTINNGSLIYGSVTAGDEITINNGRIHADLALAAPAVQSAVTTAADSSDLGNDGTIFDAPRVGVAGQLGTAFDFDGFDDYVEIPHDDAYLMQGGTFSVWFKPDNTSGRQGLFSKDSTGYDTGGHFSVFLDGRRVEVRMQSTTQSYYVYSPSNSITAGNWYHIMFAWGEEGMVLYLDGVEVDTDPHTGGTGTTSGGIGNYEPIVLGANAWQTADLSSDGLNGFFDGTLDDLRIYNERLSASQALEIFNGAVEPSPFLSEAIIEDTSGFGDPLTLAVEDVDNVAWNSGAMAFTGSTHATSLEPATKLHDAIEANGEFAIEVLLTPASSGSTASPSRIISYANGSSTHNFMLGQDAARIEARVRDSSTGNNGALSPEFITGDSLAGSGDRHVVLSYQDGEVSVFVDGELDETQTAGGLLNNWDPAHLLVFGGAYGGGSHWRGTLKRVAVYDRAFNAIQANNVFNGNDPGTGAGAGSGTGSVRWDELD